MQVRRVAEENGVDVSSQIQELETRAKQVCSLADPMSSETSLELLAGPVPRVS